MSFISKLFKPKEGGSLVGNLLRATGLNKAPIQPDAYFAANKTVSVSGGVNVGGNTTTGNNATTTPWYKAAWVVPAAIGTGVLTVLGILFAIFSRKR